jgi:hypothetical protein
MRGDIMSLNTRELLRELRDLVGGDEENPDPEVMAELDEDEMARKEALEDLMDEFGPGFSDGVELILESEFEDHAREIAEEIGAIDSNGGWPLNCIDYTSITFDGDDYFYHT